MFGFLIAVVGGAVTPMIEGPLARPLAKALGNTIEISDGEVATMAFMIAMIIAGFLCVLFGTGSALGLAVGGALGYFGLRLVGWVQKIVASKKT